MTKARPARGLAASGNRAGGAGVRGKARRASIKLVAAGILLFLCIIALAALGIWQLERRVWKLELIEQVEQRVHAPVTAAPGPEQWVSINARDSAYRHIEVSGRFLDKPAKLVQAVTALGSGFWVMSPFQSSNGFTVLINRGFVPAGKAKEGWQPDLQSAPNITGLLRITEPRGAFLRSNEPAAGRWYSRDVSALADSWNIGTVAPYFIDADATSDQGELPVGGLTVISFANNHLVYALTWFGMALLLGIASVIIGRNELLIWQQSNARNASGSS